MGLDTRVTSGDIAAWAERRINLSADDAQAYREQGNRLRAKLEIYINDHPDFDLVKMLNSGSVQKGTALRTKSDMDLGVYVKRGKAPAGNTELVGWLHDRLVEAYGDLVNSDQITTDEASVRIAFRGSGVDVECVPILYDGENDNYGELLLRNGERVETSISKHIDFILDRKKRHPSTFAQFLRLLRYWRHQRDEEGRMALSPFATELVAAHVVDSGVDPSNYPAALQAFFAFLARNALSQRIVFTDNYKLGEAIDDDLPVRIIDPVAPLNNVTKKLTKRDAATIADTAADSLDDITIARTATTKEDAVEAWRGVFGPEFNF